MPVSCATRANDKLVDPISDAVALERFPDRPPLRVERPSRLHEET
jgi:hypothetical protein